MLAKVTSKNQVTLPKLIASRFSNVDYFDISTDGNCITLRPLLRSRADEVRKKLMELGITQSDVDDAVKSVKRRA